ncbi:hypothetical protein RBI80_30885 (plasmid) [Klebsiella variicola]|nr:hypothetical protein RBI80_30885 [Klebsiella variicola]
MREFNHFDFELNGIIRAFLRTAVNDFMDSVHHIWCPLSSQEYQDLPDGAETTLTFNHFDFELNGIIRAFLRTAVNDFMDSVHHIWCPLSSQEYQDLPDGAETTLTMEAA